MIALIGDFPRAEEGKRSVDDEELGRMLVNAGIDTTSCIKFHVFNERPAQNDIENFCASKKEVGGTAYTHPPLRTGKYFTPDRLGVLDTLRSRLQDVRPNVAVALGNAAAWALLRVQPSIKKLRGAVHESALVPGLKVIPTFHPTQVLRNWPDRVVAVMDLGKAKDESLFPDIRRPRRMVHVNPTLAEIMAFAQSCEDASIIAVDVETWQGQLTEVGFALSTDMAFVVPFINHELPTKNYWPTLEEEVAATLAVKRIIESPVPKLFQNGLYDIQYFLRYGMRPRNVLHDTMLLHHSLFPELPKSLGFLGSIYTKEASWKSLRPKHTDEYKKDE